MSDIEWLRNPDGSAGKAWNPVTGCDPVSAGCLNCYAAALASRGMCEGQRRLTRLSKRRNESGRLVSRPVFNGEIHLHHERLGQPLSWRRPQRVFVNSMSDLFHQSVPLEFVAAVFGVMQRCPRHTFMVLTKRPQQAQVFFDYLRGLARIRNAEVDFIPWMWAREMVGERLDGFVRTAWPLPNVHIGFSAEDQRTFAERAHLMAHKVSPRPAVLWASLEPLLGPILMGATGRIHLDWVVTGGESGPGARPCDPAWIESIATQCVLADIPLFVKQLGDRIRGADGSVRRPRKSKGGDLSEGPAGVNIREYPRGPAW